MRELTLDESFEVSGGLQDFFSEIAYGRVSSKRQYDSTQDPDGSEIWGYLDWVEDVQQQWEAMHSKLVQIDYNGDGRTDGQGWLRTDGRVDSLDGSRHLAAGDYLVADMNWGHVNKSLDPSADPDGDFQKFKDHLRNSDLFSAGQSWDGARANFLDRIVREGLDYSASYYNGLLHGDQIFTPIYDAVPVPGGYYPPVDPYTINQYP